MEVTDRDKQMYRASTYKAVSIEISQLVQAALKNDEDLTKIQRGVCSTIKLALQQSYQEGMERGAKIAMSAGSKALREFINEHTVHGGNHMGDIGFLFMIEECFKEADGVTSLRETVVCADGFHVGAGSHYHYCSPRTDDAEVYTSVEIGFPTTCDSPLAPYMSAYGDVAGWVPANIVHTIIELHGGMVSGELPPLPKEKAD